MPNTLYINCRMTVGAGKDLLFYEKKNYISDIEKIYITEDIGDTLVTSLEHYENQLFFEFEDIIEKNNSFEFSLIFTETNSRYRTDFIEFLEFVGTNCQECIEINNLFFIWEFEITDIIINPVQEDFEDSDDSGYSTDE